MKAFLKVKIRRTRKMRMKGIRVAIAMGRETLS
jgi:hypothetical protein